MLLAESPTSQTFELYFTLCSLLVVPCHLLPFALPLLEHDKDSTTEAANYFGVHSHGDESNKD
jgi:hypothetical protein